jgi:hypothetical protein
MAADYMPRILLAGGGHTHLAALEALSDCVRGRAQLMLLSESSQLLYSGMMPGWLAGQHELDACAIDLQSLARRSGVQWATDTLIDIDFQARQAIGAQGERYGWDLLSLNLGSAVAVGALQAPRATVLAIKPFGHFVPGWQAWLDRAPASPQCVVIGGGAAAFEVACALKARCASRSGPMRGGAVRVVCSASQMLAQQGAFNGWLAARALRARGIALDIGWRYVGVRGQEVVCVPATSPRSPDSLASENRAVHRPSTHPADPPTAAESPQRRFPADLVIVATGAHAPAWLSAAARRDGLSVAPDGGIAVDADLQSVNVPHVYASGDCADFGSLQVPKSGVHALRQAPALVDALTAGLESLNGLALDAPTRPYRPQRRALALLDCCDGTALGTWGVFGAGGSAFARWKSRIDRQFIEAMRHGGQAAR